MGTGKVHIRIRLTVLGWALFVGIALCAQKNENNVIRLYQGSAPGSETWNWSEQGLRSDPNMIYNVASPTLTVFAPDKSIATGSAVIVCPGGSFYVLAYEKEGMNIAEWLNDKGVTVFVLKYRLGHLSSNKPLLELSQKMKDNDQFNKDSEGIIRLAIADGKAAINYVRKHAGEWGIRTNQIGIMGFSAGGTVAIGAAWYDKKESRPDFVAAIYPYAGYVAQSIVPQDAPPIFIAAASDDKFGFNKECINLYNQWSDAKQSAELHIYRKGNHGFGIDKNSYPTCLWIDTFNEWLKDLLKGLYVKK